MSLRNDNDTQDFLEILYERSGRTNGLYTGLYAKWARATLRAQRKIELDSSFRPSRNPGRSWVSRVFGEGQK
jgi:hypothetical protein